MLKQVPTDLTLAGRAAVIDFPVLDQHGALDDSADAPTYGVTAADGSVVVPAGTAATIDAGVAHAALTAAQTVGPDVFTIEWRVDNGDATLLGRSVVEVVTSYYVSVEEIRSSDPTLADDTKYPTAKLVEVRADCERRFERDMYRAWVPRYGRADVTNVDPDALLLPEYDLRRLRSVTEYADDGTPTVWTDEQLAAVVCTEAGLCYRTDGSSWPLGRLVVGFEYGNDAAPADLRAQFLRWIRHELNSTKSGIPDRATNFVEQKGGTAFMVITPGRGGSITGLPDVDQALKRYGYRKVGVA